MDICIIYGCKDESIAERLVSLLRRHWDVWWAGDIKHGDWEHVTKEKIRECKATIPVISPNSVSKDIFRDELNYAKKNNSIIFPFVIEQADLPFGFGSLNRTDALGWSGQINHSGYQNLLVKLKDVLEYTNKSDARLGRKTEIAFGAKTLRLPSFAFSLSSYETQISPKDGLEILNSLYPSVGLLSAYDVWERRKDKSFMKSLRTLRESESIVFLDSGNYEASRKNDNMSSTNNPDGWSDKKFQEVVKMANPDLVFSFDNPNPNPKYSAEKLASVIIKRYQRECKYFANNNSKICPIIHLSKLTKKNIGENAAKILTTVASEVEPVMLAIPERELGDGLIARMETVLEIRKALNETGTYYPLHILGTGNPITMISLAAVGADTFDGLEWCRTVADYTNGHLFHFQHFDIMRKQCESMIRLPIVRQLVNDDDIPYSMQVASYNLDYYQDCIRTMQDMIHSGQVEHLLKNTLPYIGDELYRRLFG